MCENRHRKQTERAEIKIPWKEKTPTVHALLQFLLTLFSLNIECVFMLFLKQVERSLCEDDLT